ncbi:MAG: ABC transporter permease [Gemmatimonadota bacterium]|jgi:predicted permease
MDTLLRDLRHAFRSLLRERTFSATVLLTLAVCIGANVAIFSVIHTVLLEPLPFEAPDRLVTVYNRYPGAGAPIAGAGSVDFFERRENIDAFDEVALFQGSGSTVGETGSTERVSGLRVTPSFFPLLGVDAALGRTFTEDEMEAGNHRKVVLTHPFWAEQFGEDPAAVGRDLRIDGESYTVVGVLGPDFTLPDRPEARLVLPIPFEDEDRSLERWHNNNFQMLARLAPGATVAQAEAQNAALNDALIDRWPLPNARQILEDAGYATGIAPTQEFLVRDIRPVLYMLWAGVVFVLLIGCVNIANLVLARAQTRVGEVATRLALGAKRSTVARQILTESVVAGVLGGLLGIGLGALGLRFLLRLGAAELPRGTEISVDPPVLGFALLLSVLAGLIFGAIPLIQILRSDLTPAFRNVARTGTASRRAVLVRNGLVTGQVALAFVMLIGAGLMFLSLRTALSVNPGFDAEGVLTGFVSLPEARYPDDVARRRFWEEFVEEIRSVPGVEAAAFTSMLPFGGSNSSSVIAPEGYVPPPGESLLSPLQSTVSPGYFDAMGIELLKGREFLPSDGPDDLRVLVIDEWLANRYWPDGSPLGQRMVYGAVPGMDDIPEDAFYTIVGVVATVKQNDLTQPEGEHVGAYYFPMAQQPRGFGTVLARAASGDAPALTGEIRAGLGRLDGELPLFGVETLQDRIDRSLLQRRIPLILLTVFAGVALFLSVLGIYGALAYSVSQRRREIGIRMAMGSAPGEVFRSVVGQGITVTLLGLSVGAGAAFLLTRLIQSLLFGVGATDLRVMGAVALVLAGVGLAACVIPARRATAVNPVEVLGS